MRNQSDARNLSIIPEIHLAVRRSTMGTLLPLVAFCAMAFALVALALPDAANAQGSKLAELEARIQALEKVNAQDRGRLLYRAACADCHGITGDGNGRRARGFAQPPTNFTRGQYKFRSTAGALPLQGDIERSILEGMPGTEMIPFKGLLTMADAQALAAYLRTLSPAFDGAKEAGEPLDMKRAGKPGSAVAKGKSAWADNSCADCHEADGRGTRGEEQDDGRALAMNDFRDGVFKCGLTDAEIFRCIAGGMKGTTMEGYAKDVDAEDIWAIVDYIRSLEQPTGLFGWLFAEQPSRFDYRDFGAAK